MTTTAAPYDVEHLRDRVRLYLQVMLIIDVAAYVSDLVDPLLMDELDTPVLPVFWAIVRWGVTVVLVAGWLFAKFAKPSRLTLIALESGVTIGLVLVYIYLGTAYVSVAQASYGPAFAMLGIQLLLVVRASLVPSSVSRTVVLGVAAIVLWYAVANEPISALEPIVIDGLIFTGAAFGVATAVTSHVIYGLRKQVQDMTRLGQYTLERKLGEGGMGAVYRASHAMLRREAAIKLIRPALVGKDSGRRAKAEQRFEREAHVTAQLKSPHTVQLYDFGVSAEGSFYYVMELLDGINLEAAVEQFGPMAPERVVFLLRQVCESLQEAHAAGLVHRDIKPANVFLCRHGIRYDFVKVLDFGLVALGPDREPDDEKLSVDGFVGGTPAYLAPEMAAGATPIDGRADLYAVGCVAYWLLCGHTPFEGRSPMATILAHVNDVPPLPSSVTEVMIPPQLETLVMQCLEKKPSDRPGSAAELARRLSQAVPDAEWTQERAQRWWEVHRPRTTEGHAALAYDDAANVTKAFH